MKSLRIAPNMIPMIKSTMVTAIIQPISFSSLAPFINAQMILQAHAPKKHSPSKLSAVIPNP